MLKKIVIFQKNYYCTDSWKHGKYQEVKEWKSHEIQINKGMNIEMIKWTNEWINEYATEWI